MRWTIGSAASLAAMLATALFAGGCSKPEPNPADDPRLLVIDGITITFADLKPLVDYIDTYRPKLGDKTKHVFAMRDYLLPLRVAQRDFAKERAEQLELAKGLCSVAGNVEELDKLTELKEHKSHLNVTRDNVSIPVAEFLFDPLMQRAASGPIEVPQGYFVVGAYEYHETQLKAVDHVEALVVGFVTHTSLEWEQFWATEKQRLADKVTYVHPDYRDNLPPWMKPPKKP